MNAARRTAKRRGWPRGLYESRPGYYVWRHPEGHALPIGRVLLAVAINEAIAANQHIAEQKPGLVERLTGSTKTVADLLAKMPAAEKANTAKSLRSLDKQIKAALGKHACGSLTVQHCAELIEGLAEDKARTAQAVRSRLIAVCKRACN